MNVLAHLPHWYVQMLVVGVVLAVDVGFLLGIFVLPLVLIEGWHKSEGFSCCDEIRVLGTLGVRSSKLNV